MIVGTYEARHQKAEIHKTQFSNFSEQDSHIIVINNKYSNINGKFENSGFPN